MPKTLTHNAILLRPPPGTRFSIYGSDVELQFPRGEEQQMLTWLRWWIDTYVVPEIEASLRGPVDPNPEITELKKKLEQLQSGNSNSGISVNESKIAAMNAVKPPAAVPVQVATPPKPFAHVPPSRPNPNVPVVYGPNGPMTAEQIAALPDQPGPNGYVNKHLTGQDTQHSPGETVQQTEVGEGNPPTTQTE